MSRLLALALVATLAGCSSNGSDGGGPGGQDAGNANVCPISADAQFFLNAGVNGLLVDGRFAAQHASPTERGFGLTLTGAGVTNSGFASLVEQCTGTTQGVASCDSQARPAGEPITPFFETRDKCLKIDCEAAGIGVVSAYFTMQPHTLPDDAHAFSYETTAPFPAATVTYDQNPRVTYREDVRDPEKFVVTTDLARSVRVVTAKETIDLSQTGSVALVNEKGEIDVTLRATFPRLAHGGAVEVKVDGGRDGDPTGTVVYAGRTIASITGTSQFAWSSGCTSPIK
jgi:hypothetical protein